MTSEIPIRTSLARYQPEAAADADDIENAARLAWQARGFVCLPIDSIHDDWLKRRVEVEMTERYGQRGRC